MAETSSLRSPSTIVSNANTARLKLLELESVSYNPLTLTALAKPADAATLVYPDIDFDDPKDRLQSTPSSLQSISSKSGIAAIHTHYSILD